MIQPRHLLPPKSSLGLIKTNLVPSPSLRQLPSPHLQLLRPFISRMTMVMIPRAPRPTSMPCHNRRPQHHFLGKTVGHPSREILFRQHRTHQTGSSHQSRLHLGPTIQYSTAFSKRSTTRILPAAPIFYARRATCMIAYFGLSLAINATVSHHPTRLFRVQSYLHHHAQN